MHLIIAIDTPTITYIALLYKSTTVATSIDPDLP